MAARLAKADRAMEQKLNDTLRGLRAEAAAQKAQRQRAARAAVDDAGGRARADLISVRQRFAAEHANLQ